MATFTEHTLARVLRARAAPGDEARAEQLARQAEARAARMGMVLPTHPAWLPAVHDTSRWSRRSREASLELCPSGLRILVDGRATVVPDRVGFSYLAALVARPGRDLDVMRLASGLSVGARPTSDALLDEDAIRSYRRRARELTAILERTDLAPSDIERYRREFASLTAALQSAKGLGGRRRAFPNDHERARTAVRKALVRSVAAIAAVETDLGHHLRASLTTGVTCRYAPTPGWTVTVLHQAHRERASDQGEADAV